MSSETVRDYFGIGEKFLYDRFKVVPEVVAKNPLCAGIPERRLLRIMNTGVGIEIEVENATNLGLATVWWIPKTDNSLRNNGLEFITTFGTRVGHVPNSMALFNQRVDYYREKSSPNLFQYTERCSVHVHIDCRTFMAEQVRNFLILYTIFEHGFFEYAGRDRAHNIFTVPVRQSSFMNHVPTDIMDIANNVDRYSALNVQALKTFGTMEFRHMEGTHDPKRIFNWVMLVALLRNAAFRIPHEQVKQTVIDMKFRSQYQILAQEVFASFAPLVAWDAKTMDAALTDAKLFFGED